MKISDLHKNSELTLLTCNSYEDREISGCYIGDLLSWVMSHAEADNVWITIMNNINITAVASLVDVACVILAEGVTLSDEVLQKANSVGVVVFSSPKSAYALACEISKEE